MKRKIAVVDGRIGEDMERALRLGGFGVVALPPSKRLSAPLASHPDMLIARLGGEYVMTADYLEEAPFAVQDIYDAVHPSMHFADEVHGEKYPRDVIFNSLVLGKRLYARLESLSPYLKRLATNLGYELVNVNQGYPACTVLKLSDEAVITADDGLARRLERDGIRVYKIKTGGIDLPPYEYGFIGGCAGVYDGCVYFLGDVRLHPSYDIILDAIEREGLSFVSLGSGRLIDLGGILFADEEIN